MASALSPSPSSGVLPAALALGLLCALCPRGAEAHAEHLGQAAWLTLTRDEVVLDLVLAPGARVAEGFVSAYNTRADDALDDAERASLASALLASLAVELDGQPVRLALERLASPRPAVLRTGEAQLEARLRGPLPTLAPGSHALTFTNRFAPVRSDYLAHAEVRARGAAIAGLERSPTREVLQLRLRVAGSPPMPPAAPPRWLFALGAALLLGGPLGAASWQSRKRGVSLARAPRAPEDRPAA